MPLPHRVPPAKQWFRLVHRFSVSLMGILDHSKKPHLFWYPSWKWDKGPNVVISAMLTHVIHRLQAVPAHLRPRTLYIQADNMWAENKNRYVLAFCSLLVRKGIFAEVMLHFLPRGHTHEDVDRLFSYFRRLLDRASAETVAEFMALLKKAYNHHNPQPEMHELKCVWDWKLWLKQHLRPISGHTLARAFCFKTNIAGKCIMQAKQGATNGEWGPKIELLVTEPYASPPVLQPHPMPPETLSQTKDAIQCLTEGTQQQWLSDLDAASSLALQLDSSIDWNALQMPPPPAPLWQPPVGEVEITVASRVPSGRSDMSFIEGMYLACCYASKFRQPHLPQFWIARIITVCEVMLRVQWLTYVDEDCLEYSYEYDAEHRICQDLIHPGCVIAALYDFDMQDQILSAEQYEELEQLASVFYDNS